MKPTGEMSPDMNTLSFGRLRIEVPAVVASLGGDEVVAEARKAEALGADLVEVRLDLVSKDPLRVMKEVRAATSLPLIATNRMRQEGGRFEGGEEERIGLLCKATRWADLVDVELRAEGRDRLMGCVETPVIVSYHDFKGVPGPEELRSLRDEMFKAGANIAKIAVTPHSLGDSLELLRLLMETERPLCVMGMGNVGRHLRAVAPIYGSTLTYGYVGEETAPGQMSVETLRAVLDLLMGKAQGPS